MRQDCFLEYCLQFSKLKSTLGRRTLGRSTEKKFTLLVCDFSDGNLEKPLVIVNYQNLQCFKNMKKDDFPVT